MNALERTQALEFAGIGDLVPLEKEAADRFTVQFRDALKVSEVRRLAHDFEGSRLHLRIALDVLRDMEAAVKGRQIGERRLMAGGKMDAL